MRIQQLKDRGIPIDLSRNIQQISRIESDFHRRCAIMHGKRLIRAALIRIPDRNGHLILFEVHFHGPGFFQGQGRHPVHRPGHFLRRHFHAFVIGGGNDAAVIRERAIDQFGTETHMIESEADFIGARGHGDIAAYVIDQFSDFQNRLARKNDPLHVIGPGGRGQFHPRQPVTVGSDGAQP